MPKIALIMPALGSGGVEKVMINLATGFLEKKWDVDVVVTKAEGEFKSLLPEQINLVDLQASRVLYGVPRLVQYFRRNKPHAVISAIDHQNIATLCSIKLSGVRPRPVTLVSVHIDAIEQYAHARSFKERILPIIVKKFYSKANKIITVSEGAAQSFSIKTKIPLNKIKVIYNPVVTPKMLSEANEEVVHPWFNHKDRKIIIGVGRLTKQKDFITLIKAFHLLRKKMLARLVILGEGEERPRLEAFIKELGLSEDIALLGFVKNPYKYMKKSDLFVLSSRWEGLPTVLIESMALGIPVVSTDCPSGPREILENGKYGQLVLPGDVENLAKAMIETLNNPPNLSLVQKRGMEFSLNNAINEYLMALKEGGAYF